MLFDTGFAYRATLSISQVGCHPNNREKQMIIVSNVHALIKLMAKDGYNEELFKGWVQEGPLDGTEYQDANARLWKRSEGYLASSNARALAYYTVMGSHSTSAFRGFQYGLKTDLEEYADADGALMIGKLFDKQPSLKIPVEKGLPYEREKYINCAAKLRFRHRALFHIVQWLSKIMAGIKACIRAQL